jgi:uncharacterized protein (DUF2249 family)
MVTVYAVLGHVTLFAGAFPDELYAGQVICIESGVSHRIEAIEDSALLVLSTGGPASAITQCGELDLYRIPRSQLFPLVFETFDTLELGESFVVTTDHNPVLLEREFDDTRLLQAAWEHLNRGPDRYRIRIRRVGLAPIPRTVWFQAARRFIPRHSQYVRQHSPTLTHNNSIS